LTQKHLKASSRLGSEAFADVRVRLRGIRSSQVPVPERAGNSIHGKSRMSTQGTPVHPSQETTAGLEYRIAATRKEREAAFRLVYNSYLRAGLAEPNDLAIRVTPYQLLPTTEVFIASAGDDVLFTMSLVKDGELGLPMESVYGDIIEQRRRQGVRLAEVSCLADRRDALRGFFPVFLRTSRLLAQYAWKHDVDQLLVAVHPRHARFYRRMLEFKTIGEEKSYPTVRHNPAVALCLDLVRITREQSRAFATLLSDPLPDEQLVPHPISQLDQEHFRPMVDTAFCCAPMMAEGDSADDGATGWPGRSGSQGLCDDRACARLAG
jgi:hypothetical protein